MSWITGAEDSWADLLRTRPELGRRYGAFYRSLWEGPVDRRVLEIARLRIAAIHGCEAEAAMDLALDERQAAALQSGDASPFDAPVRAALTLAEHMPFDHHGISDADVSAAADHFGPDGAVTLLTALAFFDSNCRLQQVGGCDDSLHRALQPSP